MTYILTKWPGVTQVRDGVAIDRDSEQAVDGAKYDYEVVSVDFNIQNENRLGRSDRCRSAFNLPRFERILQVVWVESEACVREDSGTVNLLILLGTSWI